MKQNILNIKLRPHAGSRIELSLVSNYPRAIVLGGNCPSVIIWGVNIQGGHCGVGNCLWDVCLGVQFLSKSFLQVILLQYLTF